MWKRFTCYSYINGLPKKERVVFLLAIFALVASYVRGLTIPLMNNDSAHHALIALRMIESGDFTSLYFRGEDYLDKPHFLFWTAALSFKVFGVNSFAYKFPSFLFSILAIYSTYRTGKKIFDEATGLLAAMILSSGYAFFLANNDVRMDAVLTACIIFSTWQVIEFADTRRWRHFLLCGCGIAAGFATKGIVAVVVPMIAVVFYLIQKKNWTMLFDIRWLGLVIFVAILLAPVWYSLYTQFDAHPEKVIRGHQNVSGIMYLLFSQSVDRYASTVWGENNNDPFFFIHTFLWAFLPWSVLTIIAIGRWLNSMVKNKLVGQDHYPLFIYITVLIVMIIISGSQFQLPHYLNILFPFLALITASQFFDSRVVNIKVIGSVQFFVTVILVTSVIGINVWSFPLTNPMLILILIILLLSYLFIAYRWWQLRGKKEVILLTLTSASLCFFLFNFNFFANLLEYQAGNMLAVRIPPADQVNSKIGYLRGYSAANSFDFTLGRTINVMSCNEISSSSKPIYLFTNSDGKDRLKEEGVSFREIASHVDFHVSEINADVLNPSKRQHYPVQQYLLLIE